jgi:hypothetical protein
MAAGATPLDPWNQPPADLWWPPGTAGDLLRSRHSVVPVLGAGFSRAAGLPLGWELARWLATHHTAYGGRAFDPGQADDCVAVGSWIVGPLDPDQRQRSLALRGEHPRRWTARRKCRRMFGYSAALKTIRCTSAGRSHATGAGNAGPVGNAISNAQAAASATTNLRGPMDDPRG